MDSTQKRFQLLENRIQALEQASQVNGQSDESSLDSVNTFISIQNIRGFVQIISTAPTVTPKTLYDQIQLYINGGTYRLYIYDWTANAWRYATLT